MAESLRLSPKLSLPADAVGEAIAILAKRGAGKSNAAKVIAERAIDLGVQVIVLDPVGHWWGLRSLFSIAVIGGMHGDVPLEPGAGKLLARVAVESGQSMVLDVSGLDTNGAMQRFAYEFAEEFYKLKQAHPSTVLVILEEADEFAPQNAQGPNVPRMVGAYARMMKRGRGRGIGMLVVSQRSAALNKNVLDQADTLIVMRTVGPRDRKAIQGWVEHQQAEGAEAVIPSLPSMQTGEAWVWTPERGVLERIRVDKARSLDTSSGKALPEQTKPLKPIDLAALGEQITALAERAKADDPAELRRRIRELERQLAEGGREVEVPVAERVEVPVVTPEQLELLEAVLGKVEAAHGSMEGAYDRLREVLFPLAANVRDALDAPAPKPAPKPPAAPRRYASPAATNGDVQLKAGARRMLSMLARMHPEPLTKVQLGTLSDITPNSGTFSDYKNRLVRAALIEEAGGAYRLTPAGVELAGDEVGLPLPSPEELRDMWGVKFKAGARRMLDVLFEDAVAGGGGLTRDELAEAVEITRNSGTFSDYLNRLKRNNVAVEEGGVVRAGDALFIGG